MSISIQVTAVVAALTLPFSLTCNAEDAGSDARTGAGSPAKQDGAGAGAAKAPFELPQNSYVMPQDVAPILEQEYANIFAWQSFIALNWPAMDGHPGMPDTQRPFGSPGEVVWETYKNVQDVFLPDGSRPSAWDEREAGIQAMNRVAKAKSSPRFKGNILEASPKVESWLVAQNKTLTRFEIMINRTVFDYIYENGFYDANKQVDACKKGGSGVSSPVGAVELKAAWLELTDGMDASRYHTTVAMLDKNPNRTDDDVYQATLGLVGLHIIHKTPNAPQYIWATFEHKDNCPDIDSHGGGHEWHYYSDTLNPEVINLPPQKVPNRVKRVTPLPAEVVALNEKYQGAIRRNDKRFALSSPWANYQLVNTQWPSNSITVDPRTKAPLPKGNPIPRILANTTMETYVQELSCLDCHHDARIAAGPAVDGKLPKRVYSSDYSFIYRLAHPASGGAHK